MVPENLRKNGSSSPNSKQNEDIIAHMPKKPRPPKVAELLPDMKLVRPKK